VTTEVIAEFISKRYACAREDESQAVQQRLLAMWDRFAPHADGSFVEEFCSGDDSKFHQRYWEMLLAEHLEHCGFTISSAEEGPDLRAVKDGEVYWFEAVVPDVGTGANRLPDGYLHSDFSSVPHEAILLRWTAAIKEKCTKYAAYRKKGIVAASEPCVIAVNSCLLGVTGFDGISQYPAAVDAVVPVGPFQITIDRVTLQQTGHGHQFRPSVLNANRKDVPTNVFLRPESAAISAIFAMHESPDRISSRTDRVVMVHNPLAQNPIRPNTLYARAEYVAAIRDDGFELRKLD